MPTSLSCAVKLCIFSFLHSAEFDYNTNGNIYSVTRLQLRISPLQTTIKPFFLGGGVALQPPVGQGLFNRRGFKATHKYTTIGRTPLDEWLPVPQTSPWRHPTLTRGRHQWPRRDSNPQSQQASGRRPASETMRPLGLAYHVIHCNIITDNIMILSVWYFDSLKCASGVTYKSNGHTAV